MKYAIAAGIALAALTLSDAGRSTAAAQGAAQCNQFQILNQDTQNKANAVSTGMKNKIERKELCKLMNVFISAEGTTVKFLADNKSWCGVPDQMLSIATANHQKSLKMRDVICNGDDAPHPKAPSLSDAIKSTPLDSAANTKTGSFGTFDSLTGNPLGK